MVKKKLLSLPDVEETLFAAKAKDVLELDEVWSFVLLRRNKRWLWTVMCRRTRQIVAFVNGDHSEETCRALGGAGAAGLPQVPQLQRLLESLRGGAPGGDSPQCRQGERGDRAHGALEQHSAPAHRALRPRDPLLLQEELVARSSDPLVHR